MHDAIANEGERLSIGRLKTGLVALLCSYWVRTVYSRLPNVKLQAIGKIDAPVDKRLHA